MPELMAQIVELRKENGLSDMAEPSRTKTSESRFKKGVSWELSSKKIIIGREKWRRDSKNAGE